MYQIGDVFYLDNNYPSIVEYCNNNNFIIIEIEADNKGRRFQIQEAPIPTITPITRKDNLILEISAKKQLLEKYKEDVEQVELFGMERKDYEEKKQYCVSLIQELRVLEKELQMEGEQDG